MNDKDLQFEVGRVFYEMYLNVIPEATVEQSKLADEMYRWLCETQEECDLYRNSKVTKPENAIHKIIKDNKEKQ